MKADVGYCIFDGLTLTVFVLTPSRLLHFINYNEHRDLMGYFLIMDHTFYNELSSYISYINIHLEKNIVDLKTGLLRICF